MVKERPTLRDIARTAGVSLSTASQALNNKQGVAPETRARVLKAATTLGYQAQVRLSTPLASEISTIGMFVKRDPDDKPALDPFYYPVVNGVENECRRLNITLMYASVPVDQHSRALDWPPLLTDPQVDGILVVGAFLESSFEQINQEIDIPVVLVDGYAPGCTFDKVVTDNVTGAEIAVRYLIENGHTHIGLVGSKEYTSIEERVEGYRRALSSHLIDDVYIEDCIIDDKAGYEATLRLLKRQPDLTAIFATADIVAMGVLQAARDLGLSVPDDLSVIGFDDIDLAAHSNPPLTTMHVEKEYMGALAVRMLYDHHTRPDDLAVTSLLSTRLIARETVALARTMRERIRS